MTRTNQLATLSVFGVLTLFASLLIGLISGPVASADTACKSTWTIGIGGLGNNDSSAFPTVDQRVNYNSFSTRDGADQLNKLIRAHRDACPNDHIKAIGHSGGAAALHVWASENGATMDNTNVILLADPKRPAGPDGPGFAAKDFPFNVIQPLAGADANYGGLPTLTVCNHDDHICNSNADWSGYMSGRHGAYDFDVNHYDDSASGQIYR